MSTPTMGQNPEEQRPQPEPYSYGAQAPQPGQQPYGAFPQPDQQAFGGQPPQYGGMPGYPQGPFYGQQPQGTSGIAIAALCTFWVPLVGLVLSIVGMVKTGAGKQRGRGLAIAALVLSILMTVVYGIAGAAIGSKTSALDPGCTNGKSAILDGSKKIGGDSANVDALKTDLQNLITQLNAAVADAHRSDVRAAMQAMSDDYTSLLQGVTTGNLDPNLQAKITTDAEQVDHLCTFGSK